MLSRLPRQPENPSLLVGYDTADDAGVYLVRDDLAIVQTVDFFTPIVDDPYLYGRIAALNSLNDVWAMGGVPVTALSVACFPRKGVGFDILEAIFRGGVDVLTENGVTLLGGHTVDDPEIKFGYAVTGTIDPAHIVRNAGARPGDALILTKPLGTGVISTAIKFNRASKDVVEASIATMLHSSRAAAGLLARHGVAGGTDITGFGLLGHAYEVATASRVHMVLRSADIPLLPGARDLARKGNLTRGDRTNREYVADAVRIAKGVDENVARVLFDPQTAGGLFLAVRESSAEDLLKQLHQEGYESASIVGRCVAPDSVGRIDVV